MPKEKWKKISSKLDYKAPYIEIFKEKIRLPDKKETDFYRLKKDDFVVIMPKEGNSVYTIEGYRFSIMAKSLEFPGGYLEKKETPLQAAKRELKEEAGITARKFTYLGWFYDYIAMSDMKGHVFLAEDLVLGKQNLEDVEQGMKVRKIKISDLVKAIRTRKIKNEATLKAFLFYLLEKG